MRNLKLFVCGLFIFTNVMASYGQSCDFENHIEIGYNTTTMLVFPSPIDRTDCGSADVLVKQDKKEGCVLKVKTAKQDITPTNLTVFTKDGLMYSLRVFYINTPMQLLYELAGKDSCRAERILHDKAMNIVKVSQLSQLIASLPYYTGYRAVRKGGMRMYLQKIFIKEDIMFLVFRIANTTNIPYEIKLTRFSIKDKRQKKRSSEMEEDIFPIHQYFPKNQRVIAKDKSSFVVAVDKLTIADNKYFITELVEKNGDRGMRLKLSGKTLLRAVPF